MVQVVPIFAAGLLLLYCNVNAKGTASLNIFCIADIVYTQLGGTCRRMNDCSIYKNNSWLSKISMWICVVGVCFFCCNFQSDSL